MLRFARENRDKVKLFDDKPSREQVEPFLTGETFQCFFNLMYELEFALKLFLGLVFNALVLGTEIDLSLPFAYVGAFAALLFMQWTLQKPIARTYLENQRMNNRVTAQGYTAWDNVFSGNRYNLRLWLCGFKTPAARGADRADPRHCRARRHERDERHRQPRHRVRHHRPSSRCTMPRHDAADRARDHAAAADRDDLRVASARQRLERLRLDLDAVRRRCRQHAAAARPRASTSASNSTGWCCARASTPMSFRRSTTRLRIVQAQPTGRINIRGGNGTGKSSLLASLKTELRQRAFYWPASDRLDVRIRRRRRPGRCRGR